jgi:peptidoglycan/xylan/chitin deacetylase (PgdA/CDA1 family)
MPRKISVKKKTSSSDKPVLKAYYFVRRYLTPERFVLLLLFAAVLYSLINITQLKSRNRFLTEKVILFNKRINKLTKISNRRESESVDHVRIIFPQNNHRTPEKEIDITGTAPEDASLSLFLNDRFFRTVNAKEGKFKYSKVGLLMGFNRVVIRSHHGEQKLHTVSMGIYRIKAVQRSETQIHKSDEINYDVPARGKVYIAEAEDFTRGDVSSKWIAITLDGGAHLGGASEVMDTLASRRVKCTFFLTGRFLRTYPEMVRRIVLEGHEVGNHTYSHPHLTTYEQNRKQQLKEGVTKSFLVRDLEKAADFFKDLTGKKMVRLWRAPYGDHNSIIRRWAAEAGWRHISWTQGSTWRTNMDSNDWVPDPGHKGYFTAEQIKQKILHFGDSRPNGSNGAVILMHIGTLRKTDQAYTKLGEIIDGLRAQGYKLVTISEMLKKVS